MKHVSKKEELRNKIAQSLNCKIAIEHRLNDKIDFNKMIYTFYRQESTRTRFEELIIIDNLDGSENPYIVNILNPDGLSEEAFNLVLEYINIPRGE